MREGVEICGRDMCIEFPDYCTYDLFEEVGFEVGHWENSFEF